MRFSPGDHCRDRKRRNTSHASTIDDPARLFCKRKAIGAVLCYMGHGLNNHRHGLVVNAPATLANGVAERDAAAEMLADAADVASTPIRVRADKNYDTTSFVASCGAYRTTPPVAQNSARQRGSAINGWTTRWLGYEIRRPKRRGFEQAFGWGKMTGRAR